jgi:hypothetical protein
MKRTVISFAALLVIALTALGQGSIAGRWQTDNVSAALAAQAVGGRGTIGQAVMMDLKVASNKVTGTITEIGSSSAMTVENGTIDGKIVTLVMQSRGLTWKLELTDENTLTLQERILTARDNRSSRNSTPLIFHRGK